VIASPIPSLPTEETAPVQPGQIGLRHLFLGMTVVALVLGVSATRLRIMTTVEAAQVGFHWLYVLVMVGGGYGLQILRRRRMSKDSGAVLFRVSIWPTSPRRRNINRWLLTAAVIADGVFISLMVGPGKTFAEAFRSPWIISVLIQLPMMEGWLWLAWIRNWLSDPYYSLEFREHGILTWFGYFFPWRKMTHLGWSSTHPQNLSFFCHGHVQSFRIDPAMHLAVDRLLEHVRNKSLSHSTTP
jgi:hypothetical protein